MHHDPLLSSLARSMIDLGARLGDPLAADSQPALVPDQGLGFAGGDEALPQPPGADQGQEGSTARARSQRPFLDPNHRTRPELAVELIARFACGSPATAVWSQQNSAYGGKSVLP